MYKLRVNLLIGLVVSLVLSSTVGAAPTPEEGVISPLEIEAGHHQHGGTGGHLPAVKRKVDLVGRLDLFGSNEQPGRISDVGVFGNHAYLGAFREPNCEQAGVYVIDISNPRDPIQAGFIPASPGAYVGEGVQVLDMDTEFFTGQVLIHNNENCVPEAGPLVGLGGASLWDVTDPASPQPLAEHVGDTDPAADSVPHQSHSTFGWQQGDRAYMVMVDNAELGETDIDILDITNPRSPQLIVETGMADFPEIAEDPPANGALYLNHDMIVKNVGGRWLMLSNYWDGGYVILDVTNLPQKPTFLRDTDFGAEPFAAQMGLPVDWIPEGNAHQGEFNFDNQYFLGADEDFNAFRNTGEVLTGTYTGDVYSATLGSNVPNVPKEGIQGGTDFVGLACNPLPPAQSPIALVERGTCTFTIKAQAVQAAGYEMGLVFNDRATDPDCESHVFMLAVADIPFLFVSRSTGLKLLNQSYADPCEQITPAPFGPSEDTKLGPVFDGWGYLHLYDTQTMQALDEWALPQALDPAFAEGFGDLSIHEVATDPTRNIAYISHYAGGFRVVKFSRRGIQEVGAFIAPGGNNLWGVQVVPNSGRRPLVLASDRDSGLWIFRYSG